MKNLKTILMFMAIGLSSIFFRAQAQTTHVAGGVFLQNDVLFENVELGQTYGKSTLSLIANTSQLKGFDRQWAAGFKYAHSFYSKEKLYFNATGAVTANLTGSNQFLVFSPGLTTGYRVTDKFAIEAALNSPIYENSSLFKPINLQAGLQVVLTL